MFIKKKREIIKHRKLKIIRTRVACNANERLHLMQYPLKKLSWTAGLWPLAMVQEVCALSYAHGSNYLPEIEFSDVLARGKTNSPGQQPTEFVL